MNVKDMAARWVTGFHRSVFKVSNGRVLGRLAGMPVLILTTTGRRSGEPRATMLTSPVQQGDSLVLVASYGGDDRDPRWFKNLQNDPDVEVLIRGRTIPMRARVASPAEKDELWPRVAQAYRGYAGYQKRTERDIPLVILDPRPS